MKCATECLVCAIKGMNRIMDRFVPNEADKIDEMRAMLRHLGEFDFGQTPAEIWRYLCENTPRLTGGVDIYAEEKLRDNRNMLAKYDDFRAEIKAQPSPFHAAVRLAICGNIIDYTPGHGMDMDAIVRNAINCELAVDHIDEMHATLKKAKRLLYLLDNAGEIVTDKLLISLLIEEGILAPDQITVAVRKVPTLNDATMADAAEVGLTDLVEVIDNGDIVPGTELSHCSPAFLDRFERADVVISKGMGNFESLHSVREKAIFFLLISKCDNVTRSLGVPLQSFVCKASFL